MIKYQLKCECGVEFESWFSNSNEYDRLEKKICYHANVVNLKIFLSKLCHHR